MFWLSPGCPSVRPSVCVRPCGPSVWSGPVVWSIRYGPQNTASRALRKHKGRSLNVSTTHLDTVTRANSHLREMRQAAVSQQEQQAQRRHEIQERLR